MEHVYTALLLDETGAPIDESNLAAVLAAAGDDPDRPRIRALVAALDGVDLDRVRSRGIAGDEPDSEASDDPGRSGSGGTPWVDRSPDEDPPSDDPTPEESGEPPGEDPAPGESGEPPSNDPTTGEGVDPSGDDGTDDRDRERGP